MARCWQLQDAIAVLELDKVLDAAPDDLDGHRLGLMAARKDRSAHFPNQGAPDDRLDKPPLSANAGVLRHPIRARKVVPTSNQVGTARLQVPRAP